MQDEDVLKACLFLLWDLVIRQPRSWIGHEDKVIRSCLALRRSDSLSVSPASRPAATCYVADTFICRYDEAVPVY